VPALDLDATMPTPWNSEISASISGDLATTTFFQLLADFSVVSMSGTLRVLPGEGETSEVLVALDAGAPVAAQLPYECGDLGGGLLPLFWSGRRFLFYQGHDLTDPVARTAGPLDPEALVVRAARLSTPSAVVGGALEEIGEDSPLRLTIDRPIAALDQWRGADLILSALRQGPTTLRALEDNPVLDGTGVRRLVHALYVLRRIAVEHVAPSHPAATSSTPSQRQDSYPLPPPWNAMVSASEPVASPEPPKPVLRAVPAAAPAATPPPPPPVEALRPHERPALAPPPPDDGDATLEEYAETARVAEVSRSADDGAALTADPDPLAPDVDREMPSRVRVKKGAFRVPSPWEVANSVEVEFDPESVDLKSRRPAHNARKALARPLKAVG